MRTSAPVWIHSIPREPSTFAPWPASAPERDGVSHWGALLDSAAVAFVSAVEWFCPPGWSIEKRRIHDDMWFCILSGTYRCKTAAMKQARLAAPGDILFVPRGEEHDIVRVAGDCRMASVHFHARCLGGAPLCSLLGLGGGYQKRHAPFRRISQRLCREYALSAPGWAQAGMAGVWEALLYLLREVPLDARQQDAHTPFLLLSRIHPALEALERNLDDPGLTVGALARACRVSEVTLRKWFLGLFGESPVTYLRTRRIAKACAMLTESDTPLKHIARDCGFSDLPFFYRVFKHEMHRTPAAYRQSGLGV